MLEPVFTGLEALQCFDYLAPDRPSKRRAQPKELRTQKVEVKVSFARCGMAGPGWRRTWQGDGKDS